MPRCLSWNLAPILFLAFSRMLMAAGEDFALRDGDTVVFLGDSITAERTYGKMIEQYTLLRYPDRKIRFINAGKGGETAFQAADRLESEVFVHQPNVVTVAYGVNDIGWGARADEEHRQKYLEGVTKIVERCQQRGIRVFLCSAAITAADPEKSEHDFLQQMCDAGMQRARDLGAESIDVQRTMREIQRSVLKYNEGQPPDRQESLHAKDGVHLSTLGAVAMGYAILKGLSAPDSVSSATIDAQSGHLLEAIGCTVNDISCQPERITFTRRDEGLPLNGDTFFIFSNRFVPITDQLNGYFLKITSLPAGKYLVQADERDVAILSAEQLAAGVNIASSTTDGWVPGGPWSAQGLILHYLTESRNQLDLSSRRADLYLPGEEHSSGRNQDFVTANEQIEALQRQIAAPRTYQFVITPAPAEPAN